jgi:hypothetical protein
MRLLILTLIILTGCSKKDDDLDKNAIIKGQTITKNNIVVYNVNRDLSKGEAFQSNFDIFLRLYDKGIQFQPTEWNKKMNYLYGVIRNKKNENGKIFYDFKGKFLRSNSPDATINKTLDCYLTADLDSINHICNITVLLDTDSLIFEMKYK